MTTPTPSIEKAFRVRLYPTRTQARTLQRLLGARRFVWNWALAQQAEARAAGEKRPGWAELSRRFTTLKTTPETAWLADLPREPFNQTLRDLERGWSNFVGGRAKRPRRKKFGAVQSARFTLDQRREKVDREAGRVQLDGIGKVRFRVTEPLLGRLRSTTVSRDSAGRWFGSFTADGIPRPAARPSTEAAIGIDLGLREVAVLSTGERIAASKHLASTQARLRRYQRHYVRQRDAAARRQGLDPAKPFPKSTRIEPSKRMGVTKRRIGRLHAKVADCRRNHQHHVTVRVVGLADVICIEDLSVKAMARSMGRRSFRRSVADAGLGELRRQIGYKAAWRGRVVSVVDRFYPSSKTCSACGHVHRNLKLRERHWACPACGAEHDRDANAAINIMREGLRLLAEGSGQPESTRRSRGTHARGEHASAVGKSSPTGQPHSTNRELSRRAAKPPIPTDCRDGPAEAGGG